MAAPPVGRGAQVRLDGDQRLAARGALSATLEGNAEARRALERAGAAPDGFTPDGATRLGLPPEEEVLVPLGEAPPAGEGVTEAELLALAGRVGALEAEVARLRGEMDALHRRYG